MQESLVSVQSKWWHNFFLHFWVSDSLNILITPDMPAGFIWKWAEYVPSKFCFIFGEANIVPTSRNLWQNISLVFLKCTTLVWAHVLSWKLVIMVLTFTLEMGDSWLFWTFISCYSTKATADFTFVILFFLTLYPPIPKFIISISRQSLYLKLKEVPQGSGFGPEGWLKHTQSRLSLVLFTSFIICTGVSTFIALWLYCPTSSNSNYMHSKASYCVNINFI